MLYLPRFIGGATLVKEQELVGTYSKGVSCFAGFTADAITLGPLSLGFLALQVANMVVKYGKRVEFVHSIEQLILYHHFFQLKMRKVIGGGREKKNRANCEESWNFLSGGGGERRLDDGI